MLSASARYDSKARFVLIDEKVQAKIQATFASRDSLLRASSGSLLCKFDLMHSICFFDTIRYREL